MKRSTLNARPQQRRPQVTPYRRAQRDPVRELAYEALRAVDERDAYANLVLPALLRGAAEEAAAKGRRFERRDAALATELVYGTLRRQGTYDAVLAACVDRPLREVDPPVLDVLSLGAHQLLATRIPAHAAVSATVDLARVVLGEGRARFVNAVLRPVYEPVHGEEWVVAAAGPAGHEWVQRAVAVREVSRRKGFLLDPADDNVLSFLTLPQLRELVVQHWPCFEPYFDDRRDLELALDELEVARHVVSRNRALTRTVLDQAERACARLLELLGAGAARTAAQRLPVDVVEELVADRFSDVVGVYADRVRLQRQLPVEDLFSGARRLDAVGIGLNLLVQNYSGRRLIRLAEEGCRVRLLFLNPASRAVRRRERELGLGRADLRLVIGRVVPAFDGPPAPAAIRTKATKVSATMTSIGRKMVIWLVA